MRQTDGYKIECKLTCRLNIAAASLFLSLKHQREDYVDAAVQQAIAIHVGQGDSDHSPPTLNELQEHY